MLCFVCIVKCTDGAYHTGITWNPGKRIREHNLGIKTSIQKGRRPVKLVYWERFNQREKAARREKEIKGWRREKKMALISDFNLSLSSGLIIVYTESRLQSGRSAGVA